MKANAPCKDCPDRHYKCHAECEKYIAYRKERDAELERNRKDSEARWGYLRESMDRMQKRQFGHYRKEKK